MPFQQDEPEAGAVRDRIDDDAGSRGQRARKWIGQLDVEIVAADARDERNGLTTGKAKRLKVMDVPVHGQLDAVRKVSRAK